MNKQLKSQTKKASATKKAAVKSAPKRKVATVAKKQQKKSPQQQQTRSFFGANPQVKANEEHGAAFVKSKTETGDYHQHPAGFLYRFTTPGQTGKGTSTNASPKPKLSDSVTVHYEGRTIDQKVFDSSYKRGEPISFRLNQVCLSLLVGLPHLVT
jgi:FKBP-type peptidyl-prolyl cis-trans isomerase